MLPCHKPTTLDINGHLEGDGPWPTSHEHSIERSKHRYSLCTLGLSRPRADIVCMRPVKVNFRYRPPALTQPMSAAMHPA